MRLSITWPIRTGSTAAGGRRSVEQASAIPLAAATGALVFTLCSTTAARSISLTESATLPAFTCAFSSRSSTSRSRRSELRSITESQSACVASNPAGVVEQQLEVAADRRERRAELVRDEGDELVLHPVELAEALVLQLRLREERLAVRLGLLARGDVERISLRVPGPAGLVPHDRVAVLEPDGAAVLREDPVLELQRPAALARRTLRVADALTVFGVQVVDEEPRVCVPLLERVAEDVLDLRADVRRRLVGRVRRVDVRDQRQLLRERAVARLRIHAVGDVDEEALPVQRPAARVAHRDGAVAHPDDRAVVAEEPVLRLVRLARALRLVDRGRARRRGRPGG